MKNQRTVAQVTIKVASGKLEYHIPSTMTGPAFEQWKLENREAIDKAKSELLPEGEEGDTSRPEGVRP